MKSGLRSSMASLNALSWACSQAADRARSPRSAARPNNPPKTLLAASSAEVIVPSAEALNSVR